MQNHINKAMRSIENKEYLKAIMYIRLVYNSFYIQKRKISVIYPKKSYMQIANSKCIKYKSWRDSFLTIDYRGLRVLNSIEKYSATSGTQFISTEGEDLLRLTRAMRNHCSLFASLKKDTKEEKEDE